MSESQQQPQKQVKRRKRVAAQIISDGNVFNNVNPAPASDINVFDMEKKSDETQQTDGIERDPRAIAIEAATERAEQQRKTLEAAVLAEDSTAYEYDSVYEKVSVAAKERARQRAEAEAAASEELAESNRKSNGEDSIEARRATSKYVGVLLQAAARRNAFVEAARDRKLRREAEADIAENGETERFITASYSARLAKLAEMEKREKAEEEQEASTKKGGLQVFCANLLEDVASTRGQDGSTAKSSEVEHEEDKTKKKSNEEKHREKHHHGKHDENDEDDEIERAERQWKRQRMMEEAKRVAEQHEEAEKQRKAEIEQRRHDEEERLSRRTTDSAIGDARARFLARKALLNADVAAAKAEAHRKEQEEMPAPPVQ